MKSMRLLCLAWLMGALNSLLAANAMSEAAPFFTRVGEPVSVPAEIADHVIFVSVMVNGHGPFQVWIEGRGCRGRVSRTGR